MNFIINALPIALFAAVVYGLTRDRVTQPWGQWLAGAAFICGILLAVSSPDDGCYTDWDGRSNPEVCD